ncbi:hypothetical protein V7128_01525 [Neobacillus vireti]|uniref:hypothetical protein n=1 Tax=Neobacillus vireti TaxID=220686 RepID=UPI002FFDF972
MENKMSRESYIESEYKKWEEKFEIPFEQEFNIKAMLSLQHQFLTLPDDHVKAKADVMSTINSISKNLNLKKKKKLSDSEKYSIMFVVDDKLQKDRLEDLFTLSVSESQIENVHSSNNQTRIKTDLYQINIVVNGDILRGQRADSVFKIEDGTNLLSPKNLNISGNVITKAKI